MQQKNKLILREAGKIDTVSANFPAYLEIVNEEGKLLNLFYCQQDTIVEISNDSKAFSTYQALYHNN